MAYHRKPRRSPWGRNASLEMVATAIVLVLLVGVLVLFLFVYHDFPLRTS
jgi:succinate dehydrogenase hydrophobic anchor subunit